MDVHEYVGENIFYSNLDPAEHMLSLKNTLLNNSLLIKLRTSNKLETIQPPSQGPHSHILMTGGGCDFSGSEILARSDFFGSMKDAGIFLGRAKQKQKTRGIFWVAKNGLRDFFVYAKKVVIFLERQILKL